MTILNFLSIKTRHKPGVFLLELFVHRLDILEVVVSPDELLLEAYSSDAVFGLEFCSTQPPEAVRAKKGTGVVRVKILDSDEANIDTQQTEQDLHCSKDEGKNDNDARNTKYEISGQADGGTMKNTSKCCNYDRW